MSDDSESPSSRRVYGRGFVDGLRKAGITNVEEFMNASKFRERLEALNGQARKVYDALDPDKPARIQVVLSRLADRGQRTDERVVRACLSTLADHGLAREFGDGSYLRVAVRAPVNNVNNVVEAQFPMSASKQIQPVPDAPPSSIDVLLAKISGAIDALASIEAVVKEMAQDNAKAEQARVRAQALMDELRNAGIVK